MAAIEFDLIIRENQYREALARGERLTVNFANRVGSETSRVDDSFRKLGQLAGGAFVFRELVQLPQQLLKVRGEFQQLEIAFTTMLRSKDRADKLFGEIKQYALVSPSSVKEVAQVTKQMLAYGSTAEGVIAEVKVLGDVAAGTSQPLGEIAYLYGTLKTQGRAYAQDIRQFAGRGIPIYEELAKVLKINTNEVTDFVSAGKVGFKEVEQAFKNMTSGQGLFAGLTEAQSKSLVGLTSQLGDAWEAALNDVGQKNEGLAATIIKGSTGLVQNYRQVIETLQVLVAAYGTYKAASAAVITYQRVEILLTEEAAVQKSLAALAGNALSASEARAAAATTLLSQAQQRLNASMLANPYVLVATAIATLITLYFTFKDEVVEIKSAQELLGEATSETAGHVKAQKTEVDSLIAVLKNQNVAESERLKAYNRLNDISPDIVAGLDFQRAKTADLTQQVEAYSVALEKSIRIEAGRTKIKAAAEQEFNAQDDLQKKQEAFFKRQKAANEAKSAGYQNAGQGTAGGGSSNNFQSSTELANAALELEAAADTYKKAKDVTREVKKGFESVLAQGTKQALDAEKAQLEYNATRLDKSSKAYKLNEDQLIANKTQLENLTAAEKKGQDTKLRTIAVIDKEIKAQRDLLSTGLSATKKAEINARIADLQTEKTNLQGKKTPSQKKTESDRAKAEKNAEKIGSVGSQSYWEHEAKVAQDALDRIDTSVNVSEANRLKSVKAYATQQAELLKRSFDVPVGTLKDFEAMIDDAQKAIDALPQGADPVLLGAYQSTIAQSRQKVDELQKRNAVKTFDEELDEKRSKYTLYQRWVEAYGKEAADAQFGDLKASGDNYVAYLNGKIAELEAKKKAGPLSDKEVVNLDKLTGEKNELTGVKSPIDLFTESLDRAKAEAGSLTEYLEALSAVQAKLGPGDDQKKVIVSTRQVDTGNERKDQLRDFLTQAAASEQQRNAMVKRYADLRAELVKQANGLETAENQEKLRVINQAEEDELEQFQQQKLEQSAEYRKLTQVILEEGQKGLRIQIANQQAVADKAKAEFGENSEVYRRAKKDLNGLTKQFSDNQLANLTKFAGLLGELGGSLAQFGGEAAEAGQFIVGLTSNLGLLTESLKKGATQEEKYAAGIQGVIGLIDVLASSAAQRKQAEEEFARNRNDFQQQYNLLLNEEIGLRSQANSSVFVKDFAGELKDGFAKYRDAQAKYQQSLAGLNGGRAKVGQRDGVDAGAVGKAALSGAAVGAVLGPVGAVVGGVIGAAIGFFGGKKKTDEYANLLQAYPALLKTSANGVREINQELARSLVGSNQLDDATKQLVQNTLDWAKAADDAQKQIKDIISNLAGDLGGNLRSALVDAFKAGEDAAGSMAKSVSASLENILSQLIFNQIFAEQFKVLEGDLKNAFENGGDLTGVYGKFFEASKALSTQFESALDQASQAAQKQGLNIFQKTNAQANTNSLSGSIKGVSEETAGVLAGTFNAIRIAQAQQTVIFNSQLNQLVIISTNTGAALPLLKSIDDRLYKMSQSGSMRGWGNTPG